MILWSVVAVAVGGWLLWRDWQASRAPFAAWAWETGGLVTASVLAFGWLWLLVRWLSR